MYDVGLMDELRDYLDYNPDSGDFTWIKDYYTNKVGSSPKPSHSEGYLRVQFKGKRLFLHRVAFYWVHSYQPEEVDHINRDTSDNRISNLRPATQKQNSCNKGSRGVSKYRGVSWLKSNKKWVASLRKDGVPIYLGCYASEYEAAVVYNIKAREVHGEYAVYNDIFRN